MTKISNVWNVWIEVEREGASGSDYERTVMYKEGVYVSEESAMSVAAILTGDGNGSDEEWELNNVPMSDIVKIAMETKEPFRYQLLYKQEGADTVYRDKPRGYEDLSQAIRNALKDGAYQGRWTEAKVWDLKKNKVVYTLNQWRDTEPSELD